MKDQAVLPKKDRRQAVLRLMKEKGIKSVSELCHQANLRDSIVGAILNGKKSPWKKNGSWRLTVEKLAEFFACTPDDLFFDEFQFHEKRLKAESFFVQEHVRDVEHTLPETMCEHSEFKRIIAGLIGTLSYREQRVLRLRFGIDLNKEYSLEEVAAMCDVTRERIRQIESKALRKMRSPERSDYLYQYIFGFGDKKSHSAEWRILNIRRNGKDFFSFNLNSNSG